MKISNFLNHLLFLAFLVYGLKCSYLEELREIMISEELSTGPSVQELKLIDLEKRLLRVIAGLDEQHPEGNSQSGSSNQDECILERTNSSQNASGSQNSSCSHSASSSQSASGSQNSSCSHSATSSQGACSSQNACANQNLSCSQSEISVQSANSSQNAISSQGTNSNPNTCRSQSLSSSQASSSNQCKSRCQGSSSIRDTNRSQSASSSQGSSSIQKASINEITEASKRKKKTEISKVTKDSMLSIVRFLLSSYISTALKHIKPIKKMMVQSEYYYQTGPEYCRTVPTWKSVLWTHKYALLKMNMNKILPNTDVDYHFLGKHEKSLLSEGDATHTYQRIAPVLKELYQVCRLIVEHVLPSELIDPSFYEPKYPLMTRSKIDGFEIATSVYKCQHFSHVENRRLSIQIAKFTEPSNHYALLDGMDEWQNLDLSRGFNPTVHTQLVFRSRLLQVIQLSNNDNFAEKRIIFEKN